MGRVLISFSVFMVRITPSALQAGVRWFVTLAVEMSAGYIFGPCWTCGRYCFKETRCKSWREIATTWCAKCQSLKRSRSEASRLAISLSLMFVCLEAEAQRALDCTGFVNGYGLFIYEGWQTWSTITLRLQVNGSRITAQVLSFQSERSLDRFADGRPGHAVLRGGDPVRQRLSRHVTEEEALVVVVKEVAGGVMVEESGWGEPGRTIKMSLEAGRRVVPSARIGRVSRRRRRRTAAYTDEDPFKPSETRSHHFTHDEQLELSFVELVYPERTRELGSRSTTGLSSLFRMCSTKQRTASSIGLEPAYKAVFPAEGVEFGLLGTQLVGLIGQEYSWNWPPVVQGHLKREERQHGVKSGGPRHVKHHQRSHRLPHLKGEVHSDGGSVVLGEDLMHVPLDDGRFSDSQVPDDQDFEQKLLLHGCSSAGLSRRQYDRVLLLRCSACSYGNGADEGEEDFRLIVIGDSTVGKSCLIRRFTEGRFAQVSDPTVGVDFFSRLNVHNWLEEAQSHVQPHNIVFLLVGHKCDLEAQRQVTQQEAEKMAGVYGMRYVETSARESINVEKAFVDLTRDIFELVRSGDIKIQDGWEGVKSGFVPNTVHSSEEVTKGSRRCFC
ncbi:hypothetical protein FQN60_000590 [Etheostoma spectabile]|uniref:Small monomeric GTPase n=1 Tax=Etheostoma spectabile TaxID=54343 RepID=A0A5J5D0C4_9PERO|nr:hypothetical protein FQN60_000590 [Etheostoma spectabile]